MGHEELNSYGDQSTDLQFEPVNWFLEYWPHIS